MDIKDTFFYFQKNRSLLGMFELFRRAGTIASFVSQISINWDDIEEWKNGKTCQNIKPIATGGSGYKQFCIITNRILNWILFLHNVCVSESTVEQGSSTYRYHITMAFHAYSHSSNSSLHFYVFLFLLCNHTPFILTIAELFFCHSHRPDFFQTRFLLSSTDYIDCKINFLTFLETGKKTQRILATDTLTFYPFWSPSIQTLLLKIDFFLQTFSVCCCFILYYDSILSNFFIEIWIPFIKNILRYFVYKKISHFSCKEFVKMYR